MGKGSTWGLAEGDAIAPGRYAVRLLGGGHRYEAYLAWDDRLFALVVAKLLRPDRAGDRSALRALAAEAGVVERLRHPAIVRSFGSVVDGERPHLILEFLEGPRLSTLIRKYGPLAVEQVLPLGLEISSALHYMSVEGLVHLDVKPRNIIMNGSPKLIDLSVAHSVEQARKIDSLVGTDAYMSPEQCDPLDGPGIGSAADIWGLGLALYEGLTGTLPFPPGNRGASDARERYPQLWMDPEPLPEEFPPGLAKPVMACLERRPADRPTAAELAQMLEVLVAVLPGRPIIGRLRPR